MPLNILMHHLCVKELARNKKKKPKPSEKVHVVEEKPKGHFTPNKREFKKPAKSKKKTPKRSKNFFILLLCLWKTKATS